MQRLCLGLVLVLVSAAAARGDLVQVVGLYEVRAKGGGPLAGTLEVRTNRSQSAYSFSFKPSSGTSLAGTLEHEKREVGHLLSWSAGPTGGLVGGLTGRKAKGAGSSIRLEWNGFSSILEGVLEQGGQVSRFVGYRTVDLREAILDFPGHLAEVEYYDAIDDRRAPKLRIDHVIYQRRLQGEGGRPDLVVERRRFEQVPLASRREDRRTQRIDLPRSSPKVVFMRRQRDGAWVPDPRRLGLLEDMDRALQSELSLEQRQALRKKLTRSYLFPPLADLLPTRPVPAKDTVRGAAEAAGLDPTWKIAPQKLTNWLGLEGVDLEDGSDVTGELIEARPSHQVPNSEISFRGTGPRRGQLYELKIVANLRVSYAFESAGGTRGRARTRLGVVIHVKQDPETFWIGVSRNLWGKLKTTGEFAQFFVSRDDSGLLGLAVPTAQARSTIRRHQYLTLTSTQPRYHGRSKEEHRH